MYTKNPGRSPGPAPDGRASRHFRCSVLRMRLGSWFAFRLLVVSCLAGAAFGCTSDSSPATSDDGGMDGSVPNDAGMDGGDPPAPDSGPPQDDAAIDARVIDDASLDASTDADAEIDAGDDAGEDAGSDAMTPVSP